MIPFPDRKYNIIYADPPWSGLGYEAKPTGGRGIGKNFDLMSNQDIIDLPVGDICYPNCALFLWITFPHLRLFPDVMDSWGFRYATMAFTWVKRNKVQDTWFMGTGNYTRANPEVCLLGIRGKMVRKSAAVRSVLDGRVREMGRKPPETRDRIVELFGDVPRIELFSRDLVSGWDCWGTEIVWDQTEWEGVDRWER